MGLILTRLVKLVGDESRSAKVLGELGLRHRGQQFIAQVIVFNRLEFIVICVKALRVVVVLLQVATSLQIIHLILLLLLELLICLGQLSRRGEQALRPGDHHLMLVIMILAIVIVILTGGAFNQAERGLLLCDWLLASVVRAALTDALDST